jgi:nucleoside-triphosphatase THEP1
MHALSVKNRELKSVRIIERREHNPVWLKATVVGSIWASIEIITGSFLHNLNIPFSGTILSAVSVWLMVAFMQVWTEKGIIWRAGLICALMKSISPSAVIIGPMTGIIMEAFLLELAVRLMGRNLAGYITGGALAVMSSLLHKIATLLIIYGFDLVKIADSFFRFAVNRMGGSNGNPAVVISIVVSIYAIAGIAAATGGFLAGRRYIKTPFPRNHSPLLLTEENTLFERSRGRYSISLLAANVAAMAACMIMLSRGNFLIASVCSAGYSIIVVLCYRNSLYRLAKWSVWIQFLIIAVASAFLWNSTSGEGIFGTEGLIAGGSMILRAAVIILGFAAISVELKNPLIRRILYNRGFALIYQALTLGFSTLPALIESIPRPGNLRETRGRFTGRMLRTSEELLPVIEGKEKRRPEIFILSGNKGEGKSTFAEKVALKLKHRGIRTTGFISRGTWENNSRRSFALHDIESGEETLLCSVDKSTGPVRQGRFWFSSEALEKGEKIITDAALKSNSVTIIDEVGPLEIGGKGWYRAIEYLCSASVSPQVWCVRSSLAYKASRRWNTGNIYIIPVSEVTPEDVASMIENRMAGISAGHILKDTKV